MLFLYHKPTCVYSNRILEANRVINAPLILRDVLADATAMATLLEKGGKRQTPFFEDTDRGVAMHESIDIIEYLAKNYSNTVAAGTADDGYIDR